MLDIRIKKEYEILERLCTYLFTEANFYHEGHQKLRKLEPFVRNLMNDIVNSQKSYLEKKNDRDLDSVCFFYLFKCSYAYKQIYECFIKKKFIYFG